MATFAVVTAMAVVTTSFLHSPSTSEPAATTDLAGLVTAVANESAAAKTATGASDYYLKIAGIPGESTAVGHAGEIEIESFSWGASNSGSTSTGGGGGAGKVSFQDFSFMKSLDKASPLLMSHVATGKHVPTVALVAVRATGKQQQDYMKITLTDVLISSYQNGGSSGGAATDSFALTFSRIEFEYRPQRADGSLDAPVKASFDVKRNEAT